MRSGLLLIPTLMLVCFGAVFAAELSDAEIREILIRANIAGYSGSCPCPESVDRAGRRCGARSAYSKPGGRSPLCYADQVTEQMIADYRARQQ